MKLPAIEVLHFVPIAGEHFVDVQRQAVAMAMEHSCDVEFGHNGRWYSVGYSKLIEQIQERDDS